MRNPFLQMGEVRFENAGHVTSTTSGAELICVCYLSLHPETPPSSYWDMEIIKRLFSGELYAVPGTYDFAQLEVSTIPGGLTGGIIVLPAAYHAQDVTRINTELAKLDWCLVILTSDSERRFPADKLEHPKMILYMQSPRPPDKADRFIPLGAPAHIYDNLPEHRALAASRILDWIFIGQVTHDRRQQCVKQLKDLSGGETDTADRTAVLIETGGFTQGIPPEEYCRYMASAKVVPCPSGPVTPESFRLYEALEAGALPIADDLTPASGSSGFWTRLFPDAPFPILTDYENLPNHITEALDRWPASTNRSWAWWIAKKREMVINTTADVHRLKGTPPTSDCLRDTLTVIMSASVIPSHPETTIIQQTVESVRHHLPHCEIIITCDGVRIEQEARRQDYEHYLHRLIWLANHEWHNVFPLIFDEHTHQVGMTREALKYVRTPLLLYVEADTPLVTDKPIDWSAICDVVRSGEVHHLRFSHEARILDVHQYLMLDRTPLEIRGVPLIRTIKYSQRPHVAAVDVYRRLLNTYFSEHAKCFIEDGLYGAVQRDYYLSGMVGWDQWRLAIYCPPGDIKRSWHTDGRAGAAKFEDKQVF